MQFTESSIKGVCANPYCTKGLDGKRAIVAIRDTRKNIEYCSNSCKSMSRYKERYRGTNSGPLSKKTMEDKMSKL